MIGYLYEFRRLLLVTVWSVVGEDFDESLGDKLTSELGLVSGSVVSVKVFSESLRSTMSVSLATGISTVSGDCVVCLFGSSSFTSTSVLSTPSLVDPPSFPFLASEVPSPRASRLDVAVGLAGIGVDASRDAVLLSALVGSKREPFNLGYCFIVEGWSNAFLTSKRKIETGRHTVEAKDASAKNLSLCPSNFNKGIFGD